MKIDSIHIQNLQDCAFKAMKILSKVSPVESDIKYIWCEFFMY